MKGKITEFGVLFCLMMFTVFSCSQSGNETVVSGVKFANISDKSGSTAGGGEMSQLTLRVGEENRIIVDIEPVTAKNKTLQWISTNPTVLVVSQDGTLTALKEGDAKVQVTNTLNEIVGSCTVKVVSTVSMVVDSVKIQNSMTGEILSLQTPLSISTGEKINLNALILPENAANKQVSWKSEKESVVRISDEGEIEALGLGSTVISVKTELGGKKADCLVIVKQ